MQSFLNGWSFVKMILEKSNWMKSAQAAKLASFIAMTSGIVASAAPVIGRAIPKQFIVYTAIGSGVLQGVSHLITTVEENP